MNISINPGSGPVKEEVSFDNALVNIRQFIQDCEIPLEMISAKMEPDRGRYAFGLRSPLHDSLRFDVDMPGIPLERVRFVNEKEQNIWDFPRLYVDGSSWVWCYATIKKALVIEILQNRRAEYLDDINEINEVLTGLMEAKES